jgi:hypothetical protein
MAIFVSRNINNYMKSNAPAYLNHISSASRRSELLWTLLIILLGILPRVAFITVFPTEPVSDFRELVNFAVALRDSGFAKGTEYWHWEQFNLGLPTLLSISLRIFPGSPEAVARWTTAIVMGFTPLVPFFIWRNALSLQIRITAGVLLALWPGLIFFSGVVAQDNWVVLPTVALAALSVRSITTQSGGYPLWSAVLFCLGTYIRQEMLLVLLPLTLVAAGLGAGCKHLKKNILILIISTLLLLSLVAGQRAIATGRFSFTTGHGKKAVMGSYVPGAGMHYWTDPYAYFSTIDPSLLDSKEKFNKEFYRLFINEVSRRPLFHAIRMVSSVLHCLNTDAPNLNWSIGHQNVLRPEYHNIASIFIKKASALLKGGIIILHAVFLAFLFLGLHRRNFPVAVLLSAILLKIFIHAVLVVQHRFFISVVALEILVIAIGTAHLKKMEKKNTFVFITAGAFVVTLMLSFVSLKAKAYILAHDDNTQKVYRFSLTDPMEHALLKCTVEQGRIGALNKHIAQLELLNADPSPGDVATAKCHLTGSDKSPPLILQVKDPYAPGGFPNKIAQRVIVDGETVLYHNMAAEPGSGWLDVPLGIPEQGVEKSIVIDVITIRPEPGPMWGAAAKTEFRIIADKY